MKLPALTVRGLPIVEHLGRLERQVMNIVWADLVRGVLDTLESNPQPALSCIVDAVSARDVDLLEELERLIASKRAEVAEETE